MKLLTVQNINIWNNKKKTTKILDNVSLDAKPGEMLGILGPNGVGKSSLLWYISGFINNSTKGFKWGNDERFGEGIIQINEKEVSTEEIKNKNIAIVPQNLYLYPSMTVLENITFSLKNMKISNHIIKEGLDELSIRFEIDEILNKKPNQISGGQQQRVAIVRALIRKPQLILFDEPLASMDVTSKNRVVPFIRQYIKQYNGAALYVTHDPNEASSFCDRVAIIMNKKIQQVGTPDNIYQNPSNTKIAHFFSGVRSILPISYNSNLKLMTICNSLKFDATIINSKENMEKARCIGLRTGDLTVSSNNGAGLKVKVEDIFIVDGLKYIRFITTNSEYGVARITNNYTIDSSNEVNVILSESFLNGRKLLFDNNNNLL